jgi:hypothetical protein
MIAIIIGLDFLFYKQIELKTRAYQILIFEVIILTLLFIALISSFFQIFRIEVNKKTNLISLKKFYSKRIFTVSELVGFYSTYYRGKLKEWRGVILKTNVNKMYRLRQQNLKSINDLKEYLTEKNVPYLGERIVRFNF